MTHSTTVCVGPVTRLGRIQLDEHLFENGLSATFLLSSTAIRWMLGRWLTLYRRCGPGAAPQVAERCTHKLGWKRDNMTRTDMGTSAKRIVVVGAGIIGASIAFHLAEWGAQVTLLDAAEPGNGASRVSFA